jgi:hypothetical protein
VTNKRKTKKLANTRMRTYIQRQKERGLVHISVWVPKDYAANVRQMVDQLRREIGITTKRSQLLYGDTDV